MKVSTIAVRLLVASLALGLVAAGCGGGGTGGREITIDEPVQLTRSFETGDVMRYVVKSSGEMIIPMQGFDRVATTQSEFRTNCEITGVREDEVDLAVRFDNAAASVAEGDNVIILEPARALRGKTLDVTMTPGGRVLSFAGLGGEQYFEEGVGDMALMLYGMFPPLPDGPLGIGDTWEQELDVPNITSSLSRTFVGEIVYTVIGFKEKYGIACVELATETSFEFEGRVEQQGDSWPMSGVAEGTGTMLISIEDGLILSSKGETAMELEGEGSTQAGAAASTEFSISLRMEGSLELL